MSTTDLISRYVCILVRTANKAGWGVDAICARAGVKPQVVMNGGTGTEGKYSPEQLAIIVHELFGYDDFLGQIPGAEKPGLFALMCEFSLLSDTLGEALERSFRFYKLVSDAVDISLQLEGETASVELQFLAENADPENLLKEWMPRMWHRFIGWLIGANVALQQVNFTHSAMGNVDDYEAIFACPCHFDQPKTRLVFDVKWLDRPVCRNLDDLEDYLNFSRLDLVTFPGDESSLKFRIEFALQKYFVHNQQFPTIERIASECCISSQTLRRRLHEEDTSYTEIKERIKRELVTEYLQNPKISLSEVARLGGFAEPSGLTRAVNAWYGVSPRCFRERYLEVRDNTGFRY